MSRSVRLAAQLYALATVGVVGFQLAVAAGAPWGHLTQGGQPPGALAAPQRAVALLSAGLLLVAAGVVGSRAGLWGVRWRPVAARGVWVVVAYLLVGIVLNAITPSAAERALWLPVTIVMAAAAFVVALRGSNPGRRSGAI